MHGKEVAKWTQICMQLLRSIDGELDKIRNVLKMQVAQ